MRTSHEERTLAIWPTEFVKIGKETRTRVQVYLERVIGEDGERKEQQVHMVNVFGADAEVAAIGAAWRNTVWFSRWARDAFRLIRSSN